MVQLIEKQAVESTMLEKSLSAKTVPEQRAWTLALRTLRSLKTVDGIHIDRRFAEQVLATQVVRKGSNADWLAWRSALTALYTIPIRNPPLSGGK